MPHASKPPDEPATPARRRALAAGAALGLAAALALPLPARADTIPVRSAELRVDEGDLLLSAEFDLALTPVLEEALQKGIPLYFTTEFELTRNRWYWFDEKVLAWSVTYRVSFNALTRQYRVAAGPLGQAYETIEEVQRFLGRIASRTIGRADTLTKGGRYEAAVRIRLDATQLPKPFQINALASKEWQLASDWFRWSFTP